MTERKEIKVKQSMYKLFNDECFISHCFKPAQCAKNKLVPALVEIVISMKVEAAPIDK